MKRILAMLLSVAMLVCYMPAMVWAEDEVAEPVVETEAADEPVVDDEAVAEPISAAETIYNTRAKACKFQYKVNDGDGYDLDYGEYYAYVEEGVENNGATTLWLKLTAMNDNSIISLGKWDYINVDGYMIENLEVYKGNSESVYKKFTVTPELDGEDANWWSVRFQANAGEVFYIKADLAFYHGDFSLYGYDYEDLGIGTIEDPYRFTVEDQEDDYVTYRLSETYIDKNSKEVWYSVDPVQELCNVEVSVDDEYSQIQSVELFKGTTGNKAADLNFYPDRDEWSGKVFGCGSGELVYIKVTYKDYVLEPDDYLWVESKPYYGDGTYAKPYQMYYNFAEEEYRGAYDFYGWSEGLVQGDNWFKFSFDDAGWFVWDFQEEENGVIESLKIYDSEGNFIDDFNPYTSTGYEGEEFRCFRYDLMVDSSKSYLVDVVFTKVSDSVWMAHDKNFTWSRIKGDKYAYNYTGKAIKPSVFVEDKAGNTLVKGVDYTVSYGKNTNAGYGYVYVKFIGKYAGNYRHRVVFEIKPKKTSLRKLYAGKKSFKVTWAKQSSKMKTSRISGYQIEYSTSSTFKSGNKFVTVKGYSTTSKTIKKLKAKKKYYVRIRTYKTVYGERIFSPWSTKKYVKTK